MFKSTKKHKAYWQNRKINWEQDYLSTWNHPHRGLITLVLKSFDWYSLWEVGVGGGANLARIVREIPNKQLGGSDINPEAIETCRRVFNGGRFHVEPSEDLLLSDNSVDVMLSDAHLIYYGPFKIKKVLKEMIRATRNQIVLCEYEEQSFWKRLWLRWTTGYHAHDYRKLLEDMGCYGIQSFPIPEQYWGGNWSKYGRIIVAQIAKK